LDFINKGRNSIICIGGNLFVACGLIGFFRRGKLLGKFVKILFKKYFLSAPCLRWPDSAWFVRR